MEVKARLHVVSQFGTMQNSFFETVEAAEKVLDDLAAAVAAVNEYSTNSENAKTFKYKATAATYMVDLRKVMSASIETIDEWDAMDEAMTFKSYERHKDFLAKADEKGFSELIERLEKRKER